MIIKYTPLHANAHYHNVLVFCILILNGDFCYCNTVFLKQIYNASEWL